jgi:hypothetical protein
MSLEFTQSFKRHSGQVGDSTKGRISLGLKLTRAGIQSFAGPLDSRFRGNDERETFNCSSSF